ncbi:hypothetical protein VCSRO164_2790 [Vibrio cholerae]|nr:hypothetical protein VCSRO164_2790 [Vibrio cholerae]
MSNHFIGRNAVLKHAITFKPIMMTKNVLANIKPIFAPSYNAHKKANNTSMAGVYL